MIFSFSSECSGFQQKKKKKLFPEWLRKGMKKDDFFIQIMNGIDKSYNVLMISCDMRARLDWTILYLSNSNIFR